MGRSRHRVCLGQKEAFTLAVPREWREVNPEGCCHHHKELRMPYSQIRDFYPVMQRAEVQENLGVSLASPKETTWRTGCERRGLIRTDMPTGAGLPGKSPRRGLSQDRVPQGTETKQAGRGVGVRARPPCEIKRKLFTSRAHGQEKILFGCFLTEELAKPPVSRGTHTDGLHHTPAGQEGELGLGRGPFPHTTQIFSVNRGH